MTVVPEYLEETDALSWASFWVGSVGAAMMMAGYFSLLRGFLTERSPYYHALNAGGGVLAATGALLEALMGSLGAYPLVVLEGVWGLLGLIELDRSTRLCAAQPLLFSTRTEVPGDESHPAHFVES
ncbi:hypothetical protein EMIHUDRAFT_218987 [Emiliania huxleyi CCMP1516]|uniref:CBU-0592-like domain-containing protein n=2 Tax=Emiliania huxleyi TaxID=2903 RepID=A0A0D3I5J1_EMIH1|nr:hypothetical protein EMIHUDRAFT_218987 [Emiliania huxleyi CCMP1516]EOD06526.1 hypothetical protein EMIHUDRAFT_218987 [Emiliania huxleyi CCMP1516]|eukprot:XP_005758955.1 hypothetical protein EMIHUDRAFT_218987 [Emiliania huxleyi CCMP1516]